MKRLSDRQLGLTVAALGSVGAGAIHIAVLPAHLQVWWASGAFFAAIAAFQVAWGLALARWRRRDLLGLGAMANVGSIVLWVVTRTLGLPFGPNAGVPENAGLAGVLTVTLELMACAGALWCLPTGRGQTRLSVTSSVAAIGATAVIVSGLAVTGVVAGVGHAHSHGQHSHGQHSHGHTGHHEHSGRGDGHPPSDEKDAPKREAGHQHRSSSAADSPTRQASDVEKDTGRTVESREGDGHQHRVRHEETGTSAGGQEHDRSGHHHHD